MKAVDMLESLIKKGDALLKIQEKKGRDPHETRILSRLWNAKELADELGKGRDTIARAAIKLIETGLMPAFNEEQKHPTTGAILGYTLVQVNALRTHYGIKPGRTDDLIDEPLILAVQSFKGGVAKTMTSVHFAQYLASKGYKALAVDMDPQASLTNLFGYIADLDINESDTILPFFEGDQPDLKYAIRPTCWQNLDLIPSNLLTNEIELQLFLGSHSSDTEESAKSMLSHKLRSGLDSIKEDYDVIILDCPPSLGLLTINILGSADAIVIPTPPSLLDFSSTHQYLKMLKDTLEDFSIGHDNKFFKLLRTKVRTGSPIQTEFSQQMADIYTDSIFPAIFPMIGEIDKSAMLFKTLLEDRRPEKKALAAIEGFCKQIELECLKTWPSKAVEAAYLEKELKLSGDHNG